MTSVAERQRARDRAADAVAARHEVICNSRTWGATSKSKHGKSSTYSHGCRCQPCAEAHATYQREWKRRKAETR